MADETRTYRRSELYEQVWAKPMRAVAKEYGVSDVALAKTCRKLSVPVPGVGYWARKRAGRPTRRIPLPPAPDGVAEETIVQVQRPDEPATLSLSPETEAIIAAVQTSEAKIVVGEVLVDPHKLVLRAERLLRRTKPYEGVAWCRKWRCLDIAVAPQSLDRALRIFDALLKALESRGLRVEITDPNPPKSQGNRAAPSTRTEPANATRVHVADEWLRIDLVEQQVPVRQPLEPQSPTSRKSAFLDAQSWGRNRRLPRAPTGRLWLRILGVDHLPGQSVWRDGRRPRIEQYLNDFIAGLYMKAEAVNQARIERERRQRAEQEAERRRWEERQQEWEDERRLKEFQETLARWRLAQDIRSYIKEVHDMVTEAKCHLLPEGPFNKTLEWGLAYADKIDPLTPLAKELAEHIAKRQADSDSTPPTETSSSP